MKLRSRFLPRAPADYGAFIFVLVMIPSTYIFEFYLVLPTMYPAWSFWYTWHFICGTFIMMNITSNFLTVVVIDTSICGEIMPSTMEPKCRFCSVCETVAPPRSWHCTVCKTCILKRDHHCMFTGCCIGHFNQRYFVMFLFYVFAGTLYATYFNCFFVWHTLDFRSPLALMKIVFPMAMLVFGIDASEKQCYLLLFLVNIVAMFFTCALLWYHVNLVLQGQVTYEKNHKITEYNLCTKQNIKEVFGERWYVAWILPFIESDLPQNGIKWKTEVHRTENIKTR